MDAKTSVMGIGAGPEESSFREAKEEKTPATSILNEVEGNKGLFRVYALLALYGFIILFCYLYNSGDDDLVRQRLWACVVTFLGLVPSMLFFWSGKLGRIPLLPLLALYHALAYGVGGFYAATFDMPPYRLLPAQEGTALGLVGLMVGYYLVGSRLFSNVRRFKLGFRPSLEDLLPYAWIFLISVETLNNIPKPWPIIGFAQQAVPAFAWLAMVVIFINFLRDGNWKKPGNFIFLFLIIPFELLLRMSTGAIGAVMALTMVLGIVYINYRKAIPLGIILGTILFAVIMQPIKGQFRDIAWSPSGSRMSMLDKGMLIWDLFEKNYGHHNSIQSKENPPAMERLSQLGILAVVINKAPAMVPLRYGSTYPNLITKWIPRILWPGKPMENQGNQFGHWYGLVGDDDETTSINLPWLVEFYVNFGWGGLFWGMFVLGVIMYYFSAKFCNQDQSLLEYGINLSMVFQIWWAESNFSLMWGGFIISAMSYVVFFWILKRINVKLVEPTS